MSETAAEEALIRREYTRIIEGLIADAVAPSIAAFQQTLSQRLEASTKSVSEASSTLAKQSDQLTRTLGREIESQVNPVRDDVEELNSQLRRVATRVDTLDTEKTVAAVQDSYTAMVQRLEGIGTAIQEAAKVSTTVLEKQIGRQTSELGTRFERTVKASQTAVEKKIGNAAGEITHVVREESAAQRDATRHALKNTLAHIDEQFVALQRRQDDFDMLAKKLDTQISLVKTDLATNTLHAERQSALLLRQTTIIRRLALATVLLLVALFLFGIVVIKGSRFGMQRGSATVSAVRLEQAPDAMEEAGAAALPAVSPTVTAPNHSLESG